MLEPLGFNNTFTILVRGRDARERGLRTIDDLRPLHGTWTPGFGYEFLQREDGYPGLVTRLRPALRVTAARHGSVADLSRAGRGQVDVIAGDATSALIDALDLAALEDNRHYFPPYDAVPVVRDVDLLRHPAVGRALDALAGRVSDSDMRAMNAAVDLHRRDAPQVVR